MIRQRRPTDIDRMIGNNLRFLRLEQNLSQMELGSAIGVSFQQIQKYEKGVNRLTVSRLLQIAGILNIQPERVWQTEDKP